MQQILDCGDSVPAFQTMPLLKVSVEPYGCSAYLHLLFGMEHIQYLLQNYELLAERPFQLLSA